MNGLEAVGYVLGGALASGVLVFTLLGKMVNQQVNKGFEHALNGDGNGKRGLSDEIKELKSDFRSSLKEAFEAQNRFCDAKHEDVDRRIKELSHGS
ncbi:MAG: hypothetical protein Q8R28_01665 [Dehalococcoidia bacterium]|nr:hypothetical protein [Dehalococcoidia bacterium]